VCELYELSEEEIGIVDMYNAVHSLLYRVSLYNRPHEYVLQHSVV
jgi:hypothetical protein